MGAADHHDWHLCWAWWPVRLLPPKGAWTWWRYLACQHYTGGYTGDDEHSDYTEPNMAFPFVSQEAVVGPGDLRKRLEAVWRLDPWHERPVAPETVNALLRWNDARDKARPWHYAVRLYRRVVLARKDWRLPWR